MKRFLLILSLIILSSNQIFAEIQDYSNIKGDYKIFCLGDTQEIVNQKINHLKKQKEIRNSLWGYTTTILNTTCRIKFTYNSNQLDSIKITFVKMYSINNYNAELKDFIENDIKQMFTKLYGNPTQNLEYPNNPPTINGTAIFSSVWELDNKIIKIGYQENDTQASYLYDPIILISANLKNNENVNDQLNDLKDF